MPKELEVRYVDLPDMTVASALGFGKQPEHEAARLMSAFTGKVGIEPGLPGHPSFGFNNPNPSPGSENYGYELWCRVDPDTKAEPPIKIKRIPAARYAVTRFTGLSNIGAVWKRFAAWVEDHHGMIPSCEVGSWLESLQNPGEPNESKWIFDLYLVVGESQATVSAARDRGRCSSDPHAVSRKLSGTSGPPDEQP